VLRQPTKSGNKKKPASRKPTSASSAKPKGKAKGQGKWRLITNVASLLSLSIVELKLKVPPCPIFILSPSSLVRLMNWMQGRFFCLKIFK
jgi:hypothetical protein